MLGGVEYNDHFKPYFEVVCVSSFFFMVSFCNSCEPLRSLWNFLNFFRCIETSFNIANEWLDHHFCFVF